MNANKQISRTTIAYLIMSYRLKQFRLMSVFLLGLILFPIQQAKSDGIFLKCTGKFEIDRGELIKPDWETSYLRINLNGIKSIIYDKGIKKEGRTLIRRNYYTITHRDSNMRIKAKYKIDSTHGTYIVNYPQVNRTLIGTCQKGRG